MTAATCLRCRRQGYRTTEAAGMAFNNVPIQIVTVYVELCQPCRTAARSENRAAILRGGPAQ